MVKRLEKRRYNKIILLLLVLVPLMLSLTTATTYNQRISYVPDDPFTTSELVDRGATTRYSYTLYESLLAPSGLYYYCCKNCENKPILTHIDAFIHAEDKTGVNAEFLLAVAILESSWGTSDITHRYNNVFGYTDSNGGYMKFESIDECISFVSDRIKSDYLTTTGKYYNGNGLFGVNVKYSQDPMWKYKVLQLMLELQEGESNEL